MQGNYVGIRFGETCTVILGGNMIDQLPFLDNLYPIMIAFDARNATTIECGRAYNDVDCSTIINLEKEGIR